jgi:hypothetical protein
MTLSISSPLMGPEESPADRFFKRLLSLPSRRLYSWRSRFIRGQLHAYFFLDLFEIDLLLVGNRLVASLSIGWNEVVLTLIGEHNARFLSG